ncbi:MAP7 domain-containing protein 1-like [Quercus lobata]|uniref:MAP7 domain-containing protein 1-like n=1 Tax=Quercus lobata TaxID=97700 RepID=UPI001243D36A|nr:MAP7 domain-containing protein 1-like [Quercus lobata]
MEGQPGKSAPAKTIPSQAPSLPARSPPPAPRHPPRSSPQPSPPSAAEQKKRREQRGKEVADASKSRPTREEDVQRAAKQQKTKHPATRAKRNLIPHILSHKRGYQLLYSAEEQAKLLCEANAELKKTQEQVLVLKKHLEETQKLREQTKKLKEQAEKARINSEQAMNEAEQRGYEIGIAEIEKALRAEVPEVCRIYYARTWSEALNRAGVEASSELCRPENVYYPEDIRPLAPQPYQADTPSQVINLNEEVLPRNSPPRGQPGSIEAGLAPLGASPNKSTTASEAETAS